ncbi:CDP-glucose 4,6-dehydratase [Paenibacillus sp. MBLB4367]|uniref:CDP-glucose 4,6-dehydratase n=1 Tax=Paenibacillus sp. MBLB4367 TaxID=3384767 RepID=UPI00390809AB
MADRMFWNGKKVFVTGHTGFKGGWLCLWLHLLGARVTGYGLRPPTNPSLYASSRLDRFVESHIADIRNKHVLYNRLYTSDPDIVIHMAAQPLVRESYRNPGRTFEVNVMGTVNLLEAVTKAVKNGRRIKAVINVTTDKCYENKEWIWGYREHDALGGHDPYSGSKACSELVTSSYRNSFFQPSDYGEHGVAIASARAGNVIGGGDWSAHRLVPDCMHSLQNGQKIKIRNPRSIRPWQHVLEPSSGYMALAQKLYEKGPEYAEGWNFGPGHDDAKPVQWIVSRLCEKWGNGAGYEIDTGSYPHEASQLRLDCSKAGLRLDWHPKWHIETAVDKVVEWTRAYASGRDPAESCIEQINEYERTGTRVTGDADS